MRRLHKKFGKPIDLTSYKGRINPDFYKPDFVEKISQFKQLLKGPSHQILFNGRNRISVVPMPLTDKSEIEMVAKEFFTRGLKKIKTIVLPSKAKKAWWGGIALMERNIPTPIPVAFLEKKRSPFIEECCYFTRREEEVEEIRHLFRQRNAEELSELIRALAHSLSLCHQEGILHRDLSDGNILVRKSGWEKYSFFLIDTNRISIKKRLGRLKRIKNLTRLGIPDTFQPIFLEEYSQPEGLKKSVWFWYRFCKKAYTLRIDLKKRLHLSKERETRKPV